MLHSRRDRRDIHGCGSLGNPSLGGHQLIVGTLLNDLAVLVNGYSVGISHGFQPVSDHNDRLVMGQLRDGLHQLLFISPGQCWPWLRPE